MKKHKSQSESEATITFTGSEAGYHNTLGYYVVGEDGSMHSAEFAFKDVKKLKTDTEHDLKLPEGDNHDIGVFIVANGYSLNKGYHGKDFRSFQKGELKFVFKHGEEGERTANIADDGADISLVYVNHKGHETVIKGNVFHTTLDGEAANLNPDHLDHVKLDTVVDGDYTTTTIGFEDLLGLGDEDFQDVVLDIKIHTPNTAPVAQDDAITGDEDTVIAGNVLDDNGQGADTDPDGDTLSVVAETITTQNGGTVVILANGDFTYIPAVNFVGSDSFDYSIADGRGGTDSATVSLSVENVDINGTPQDDNLTGTGGADEIFLLAGDDTIEGSQGADTIDGGAGIDSINYSNMTEGVVVYLYGRETDGVRDILTNIENAIGSQFLDYIAGNEQDNIIYGLDGDDTLTGNAGDDTLYGGNGADILKGGYGVDALYGNAGDDILYGLDGDDILVGGAGNDYINGGAGLDTVSYASATGAVTVHLNSRQGEDGEGGLDTLNSIENIDGSAFADDITGNDQNNVIHGNDGNDALKGNEGDDELHGGEGIDTLIGGDGTDALYGDNGNDFLYGMDGDDTLVGGAGNDKLYGDFSSQAGSETGNDILFGNEGNDYLYGHAGDDILVGGDGNDVLVGGSGSDIFGFQMADTQADAIYDFTLNGVEADALNITDILSGFDALADDINDFVQLRTWGANRTDLKVNLDGEGSDFVTIAVIYGSDFSGTTVDDLVSNNQLITDQTINII